MSKHTPGPWMYEDRSSMYGFGHIMTDTKPLSDRGFIAAVHPRPINKQDEANARLYTKEDA